MLCSTCLPPFWFWWFIDSGMIIFSLLECYNLKVFIFCYFLNSLCMHQVNWHWWPTSFFIVRKSEMYILGYRVACHLSPLLLISQKNVMKQSSPTLNILIQYCPVCLIIFLFLNDPRNANFCFKLGLSFQFIMKPQFNFLWIIKCSYLKWGLWKTEI